VAVEAVGDITVADCRRVESSHFLLPPSLPYTRRTTIKNESNPTNNRFAVDYNDVEWIGKEWNLVDRVGGREGGREQEVMKRVMR